MTDLDKMARDILDSIPDAAFGTAADFPGHAHVVLESEARYAIRAALLTAPPGYVLVPVEPTDTMVCQGEEYLHDTLRRMGVEFDDSPGELLQEIAEGCFNAMLAAAPEVK